MAASVPAVHHGVGGELWAGIAPLLLCSLALLVADSPLRTNPVGIIFYLVIAAYFLVGTLQLFYGFPRSPPENSLMSKGYDPPIPLLYRCVA